MGRYSPNRRSRKDLNHAFQMLLPSPNHETGLPQPLHENDVSISTWLDDNLSRQTPNETIITNMKELNHFIETHVQTYIHTLKIPRMEQPDLLLVKAGMEKVSGGFVDSDFQMGTEEFSGLLIDARTRRAAVRIFNCLDVVVWDFDLW